MPDRTPPAEGREPNMKLSHHERRVLKTLKQRGPLTVWEISEEADLAYPYVREAVSSLGPPLKRHGVVIGRGLLSVVDDKFFISAGSS